MFAGQKKLVAGSAMQFLVNCQENLFVKSWYIRVCMYIYIYVIYMGQYVYGIYVVYISVYIFIYIIIYIYFYM